MALDRRLTRIGYSGDMDAARAHMFDGMLLLDKVREQLSLSQVGLKNCRIQRDLPDGTILEAISVMGQEQVNIFSPIKPVVIEEILPIPAGGAAFATGIIFHPRSDDKLDTSFYGWVVPMSVVKGGWTMVDKKYQYVNTDYIYPLVDEDRDAFLLVPKGTTTTLNYLGGMSGYGNFYLVNPKDPTDIISWKGCPSRQVATDPAYFTMSGVANTPETIAFTSWIYKKGAKYIRAPKCNGFGSGTAFTNEYGLILGCGYNNGVLMAIIAYTNASDPAKPHGPYVSLWSNSGSWKEIAQVKWPSYPHYTIPWSFSTDGSKAVSTYGDTCDITYDAGSKEYSAEIKILSAYGVYVTDHPGTQTITGWSSVDDPDFETVQADSSYIPRQKVVQVRYRKTVFGGQEQSKFFGYHGASSLNANIKVNTFSSENTITQSNWNTVEDFQQVQVPKLPNNVKVGGSLPTLGAGIFLDDMPFGFGRCGNPPMSWGVSGPATFTCIDMPDCYSILIRYNTPSGLPCFPPNADDSPHIIPFVATASCAYGSGSYSWSETGSLEGGYWHCSSITGIPVGNPDGTCGCTTPAAKAALDALCNSGGYPLPSGSTRVGDQMIKDVAGDCYSECPIGTLQHYEYTTHFVFDWMCY